MKNTQVPYKLLTYAGLGLLLFIILGMFKPFAIIKAGETRGDYALWKSSGHYSR